MVSIPKRVFDIISPLYDFIIRGTPPKDLVEVLGLSGQERVLEIGAGTGRTIQSISQFSSGLWLLDPSENMLNIARKKIPFAHFVHGYVEKMPFENAFFDRVFAIDSLHHWDNQLEGLLEISRVLKTKGCFVVYEFDPHTRFGHYIKSMERFLRMGSTFYSPQALRELLRLANLQILDQHYTTPGTYITVSMKIR